MRYRSTNMRLAPPVRSRCDGDHKNALFCRVLHTRTREGGTVVTRTRNGAPSMPLPLIPSIAVFRRKLAGFPIATFQAGETVLTAASTTGLMLREGAVAVLKEGVEIATVTEPGAVFGELSVLLDQADVRALETSQFYVADAATLLRVDPVALLYVATVLARRLDDANQALVELRRQLEAGQPRSVIEKKAEEMERLLVASGANLAYARYPYDLFAPAAPNGWGTPR